jgi:hypothetical protein
MDARPIASDPPLDRSRNVVKIIEKMVVLPGAHLRGAIRLLAGDHAEGGGAAQQPRIPLRRVGAEVQMTDRQR